MAKKVKTFPRETWAGSVELVVVVEVAVAPLGLVKPGHLPDKTSFPKVQYTYIHIFI
jgi:hypothetical protein